MFHMHGRMLFNHTHCDIMMTVYHPSGATLKKTGSMKSLSQQSDKSDNDVLGIYYGYIIVAIAFLSNVAIFIVSLTYGIFFKPMAAELQINRTATSGAFSLCRIMGGAVAILMGWLVDRTGARIVLIISAVLTAFGCFLMSRITTTYQLYLVYGVILGVGSGIFAPMVALVAKWFVSRRALLTGIVICSMGVASFLGPPVANALILSYGWRVAYLTIGIAVGALVLIVAQFMRKEPSRELPVQVKERSHTAALSAPLTAYSLKQALCTGRFWIFFIMSMCFAYCYMAGFIHIAPYITDLKASAFSAAVTVAVIGLADVVGLLVMGNIGDKIGNKRTIIIGYWLLLAAMCSLLLLEQPSHFYIFSIILGFAYGSIASQRPPLIAAMFGVKSHGLIFAVVDNSFTVGAAIGPIMTGYIYDRAGGYHTAFIISAIIAAAGLLLAILLKPEIDKKRQ